MTYSEFISHFNFPISTKEYHLVMRVVPDGSVALYKSTPYLTDTSVHPPIDTPCGKICFVPSKNNNRVVCSLFKQESISIPYVTSYWNHFVSDIHGRQS